MIQIYNKNEIKFAATWTELESIMLSKTSQKREKHRNYFSQIQDMKKEAKGITNIQRHQRQNFSSVGNCRSEIRVRRKKDEVH